ncbi:hypothetical protein JF55_15525 [Pseudomonas sp. 1-7]|nr:hypothetical protein JF55_15525 [Pseudomonas sp. 1-7]
MAIQPRKLFAKPEAHFFRRIVQFILFFPAAPDVTNVLFVLRERLRIKLKQRIGIIHDPANSTIHQLKENWLRDIARALAGPTNILRYFVGFDIIFLKEIIRYPLANRKKLFEYLALTIQL